MFRTSLQFWRCFFICKKQCNWIAKGTISASFLSVPNASNPQEFLLKEAKVLSKNLILPLVNRDWACHGWILFRCNIHKPSVLISGKGYQIPLSVSSITVKTQKFVSSVWKWTRSLTCQSKIINTEDLVQLLCHRQMQHLRCHVLVYTAASCTKLFCSLLYNQFYDNFSSAEGFRAVSTFL